MRSLLLFFVLSGLLGTAQAEPSYLVHIDTESPRGKVSVFNDWGSGALVDPSYVLTCSHNIEVVHNSITVTFKNGDQVEATVFRREPVLDLCVLKLAEPRYEKPIKVSEGVVGAGQTVTVWGYPGAGDAKPTPITGDVFPAIINIAGIRGAWFRFDGQAEQGVSGGPCLNRAGELVGVEVSSFPVTGVRCVNTPQVRRILRELP